jgi:putative transposase
MPSPRVSHPSCATDRLPPAAGRIRRRGPWRGLDDVELATLEWVDWHNNRRLHTACHDLTPVEYEQVFYGQHPAQQTVGVPTR